MRPTGPALVRAVGDLQADIERVTSRKPAALYECPSASAVVIVGTLGKSAAIDALVAAGKLDASDLRGKWESFVITTVVQPLPGVERALVIAGSDKRGTIYGIYELSEQLGVSPWYWWADVPPKNARRGICAARPLCFREPVVRYRGIFLNDERPCLTGWAKEKFGGINSKFYTPRSSSSSCACAPTTLGRRCGTTPSTRTIRSTRSWPTSTASSWELPTTSR
jgi:hypothetical protein